MALPRRTLGRTGLEVTTLGLGAMELRGAPNGPAITDTEAGHLLNSLLDEGVNFIDNIRAGVEHSLRTMRTDHLDVVQFHRSLSPEQFNAAGALDAALVLRDEGKARFVGVSAVVPTLDQQIDMGVFDVFQIPWSALQPEHGRAITRASEAGAGIIIRGGVARGAPADWDARTYYMVSTQVDQLARSWPSDAG
jgi:aryl-alcohol dehydrogenase-like predicted oxidoreductase